MTDFIEEFNGDFIYINCDLFPITSFMYRNRIILKQESVYGLHEYVSKMIKLMGVDSLNLNIVEEHESDVLELVMNEKGIVKISLKGKYYG